MNRKIPAVFIAALLAAGFARADGTISTQSTRIIVAEDNGSAAEAAFTELSGDDPVFDLADMQTGESR